MSLFSVPHSIEQGLEGSDHPNLQDLDPNFLDLVLGSKLVCAYKMQTAAMIVTMIDKVRGQFYNGSYSCL